MTEVSQEKLALAEKIGQEVQAAFDKMASPENATKDALTLAPQSFQERLAGYDVSQLRQEIGQQLEQHNAERQLLGGSFACSVCTTLLYAAIVAALGATIIVSGGMSIPAVLAASGYSMSGLAVVISAITGVSTGAITAMLTAGGTTLGVLVIGLCEAMGKC